MISSTLTYQQNVISSSQLKVYCDIKTVYTRNATNDWSPRTDILYLEMSLKVLSHSGP